MINACKQFIEDNDKDVLSAEIRRYLNDPLYRPWYRGEVRIQCQWIMHLCGYAKLSVIESQVLLLLKVLDKLSTSPMESL